MEIIVGRAADCDYQIDHKNISRYHCKIIFSNGKLFITDLNSANGTFINKERIEADREIPLRPNSEILLAGTIAVSWDEINRFLPITNTTTVLSQEEVDQRLQRRERLQHSQESRSTTDSTSPSSMPPAVSGSGLGREVEYFIESRKSYVAKSFLALVLYYVGFYLVGLIVNIIFLSDARKTREIVQRNPPGYSCLLILLFFHLAIPTVILFLFLLIMGGVLNGLPAVFH